MGDWIRLESAAGPARAWRAEPAGAARGAVVVLQEIFGVTAHVRDVAERFAGHGFAALAPALFDPVEPDVQLDYDADGLARGRALVGELGFERALQVVDAAAARLRGEGHAPGVVGYCWGGSLAFLANTRLGLPAVSYYGARSVPFLGEVLRAPMQFHFGGNDASTPAADIERHREAQPAAQMFVYADAGHAFNRDVDPTHFHAASAALAERRALDFLATHTT